MLLLDDNVTNGMRRIEDQVQRLQKYIYDSRYSVNGNVPQHVNEMELEFDFPIKSPEYLAAFLENLNQKEYRDTMVG